MRSPELNYELPKPSKIRASQQPTYLTHAESSPLSSILVPCAGIRQPSNEHQTTAHRGAARELFCGSVYGVMTGFLVILVAKNIAARARTCAAAMASMANRAIRAAWSDPCVCVCVCVCACVCVCVCVRARACADDPAPADRTVRAPHEARLHAPGQRTLADTDPQRADSADRQRAYSVQRVCTRLDRERASALCHGCPKSLAVS